MRITGGKARGVLLKSMDHHQLRPSGDALRESLFSSLGDRVVDARVLDLFAGTGAYGLEALSRGAQEVSFVEQDRKVAHLLKANILSVQKSAQLDADCALVKVRDVLRLKEGDIVRSDIVFVDPPYLLMRKKMQDILSIACLFLDSSERARLIVESPADMDMPEQVGLEVVRVLGKTGMNRPKITIYRASM